MTRVFSHENRLIVFNIRNLLEAEGIPTVVENEFSSSAVGDLSPFETWPEVWILNDADLQRALEIVDQVMPGSGRFEA